MYTASSRYAAEWPEIIAKTGCKIVVKNEIADGCKILGTDRTPCEFQLASISDGETRLDLRMEMNPNPPWGCMIMAAGGNLPICLAAQLIASGGNYLGSRDLLRKMSVWCDVSSNPQELLEEIRLLLAAWKADHLELILSPQWSTASALYGSTDSTNAFASYLIQLGRSSISLWIGPTAGNGFFLAYRLDSKIFAADSLVTVDHAMRNVLSRRGAHCIREGA